MRSNMQGALRICLVLAWHVLDSCLVFARYLLSPGSCLVFAWYSLGSCLVVAR